MMPTGPLTTTLANGKGAGPLGQWSTGLCSWCDDGAVPCVVACCLPCITFGQVAEVVNGQDCFVAGVIWWLLQQVGCCCLYSIPVRGAIRQKYGIPGGACGDCCLHVWCICCAFLQEQRELKVRGAFGPNGMHRNVGVPVVAMVPPPVQYMPTKPY
eukprot:jgi/Chlat1/6265/Chrsp44S05776